MRRVLLISLAVLAVAPAGAAVAAPALVVGIADQKDEMFADARFSGLGVRDARLAVAWDALRSRWQRVELDAWLAAAQATGVRPLITFDHSRVDSRRRMLPTPAQLTAEFRRFRARYPWVTQFATWNEANFCGQKTCHRPRLVAAYYRRLKLACPSCTILAAEILDMPGMTWWVKAFVHAACVQPKYWGLHNYLDANRLRTSGTRELLRATKGEIWFTETGGIVRRRNRSRITFPESTKHAAVATRWVFRRLVALSPRVTHVYLYHWNPVSRHDTWDSALLDLHGRPRPAFNVLRTALARIARRR